MSPSTAVVNGDSPNSSSSAFLSHLKSYPVISDTLKTVENNPFGSKAIAISHRTYVRIANPILPYLNKPYQYAAPYLTKADQVGDNTLSTIDEKFPVVKKSTGELYNESKSLVFFPLTKGLEGKEYVVKVYGQVAKKQGDGLLPKGKAMVVTGLLVTSDVVSWLGKFLVEKKAEAKDKVSEKM